MKAAVKSIRVILLSMLLSSCAHSFSIRTSRSVLRSTIHHHQASHYGTVLHEKKDEDEDSEPISLAELSRLEEESSRKNMEQLLFPNRLGAALSSTITALAWVWLLSGVVLNYFGYAYIKNPNGPGITIGTLEDQAFQGEVRKSMKESQQKPSAIMDAAVEASNERMMDQ